jgi:hypothetical protein
MNVLLTEAVGQISSLADQPIESTNSSNSWGVGPILGVSGNCLLGKGFRLEGSASTTLVYTTYTSINHSETVASTLFNPGPYTATYTNYIGLRPNIDAVLGLGYGKYLHSCDMHIDFAVAYEFSMYWGQNMMRKLLDNVLTGTSPAPSDLLLQGLILSLQFAF